MSNQHTGCMRVSVCLVWVGVWPSGPVAVDKVRMLPNRVLLSATRPVCQTRCFVRICGLLPAVMAGFEVVSAQSSPCPQVSRQGPVTLHLIWWIMASLSDTFLVAQLYLNCPFLPWKVPFQSSWLRLPPDFAGMLRGAEGLVRIVPSAHPQLTV